MAIQQLKDKLKAKPSYLKKGKQWLADAFECTIEEVTKVLDSFKDKTKEYRESPMRASKMSFFRDKANADLSKYKKEISKSKQKVSRKSDSNILIIGDLHCPFVLDGYLEHCKETYEKFKCDKVVFIGDLCDNHAISYHEHDPDGKSPYDEYELAIKQLKEWYKAFPVAKVCIGNHDALPMRKIYSSGLPKHWLKSLENILETPKEYDFAMHHEIDGVFYTHGTGVSGDAGALRIANQNRQSAVIGHLHSVSNIKYSASYKDLIFAMTVGCGLDYKQYAFAYGKDMIAKPIISCAVVMGGQIPVLVPMEL